MPESLTPAGLSGSERPMPNATTRTGKKRRAGAPLMAPSDVRAYLIDKAATIAPADVQALVASAAEARQKVGREGTVHQLLQRQVDVACKLLRDHLGRRCPQIPYQTVSLITVGMIYLMASADAIPDWIPEVGLSDDALVLELAFEAAAPGVRRYCEWKGIPADSVLPRSRPTAQRRR